ncbi:MAG: helix-hairpin-helix domain-containing protein [Candidatus Acidoferrales bacterium]
MVCRDNPTVVLGGVLALALLLAALAVGQEKPEEPININTATVEELARLPGVGEVIAQRILRHREVSGKFRSVDELVVIRGISRRKLEAMRSYVTVEAKEAEEAKERD